MYWFLERLHEKETKKIKRALSWFGLGIIALFFAGVPFLATESPLRLDFPYSRFGIAFAFGAALFLASTFSWISNEHASNAIAAIVLILSILFQFNQGFLFRADSRLQRAFFWQMVWRMPQLEKGTILLSDVGPIRFSSDSSMSLALNWTYAPENHSDEVGYIYYYDSVRLGKDLPTLKPGTPFDYSFLAADFQGNTENILVVHYDPPGCFHVLTPTYDMYSPLFPENQMEAEQLSKAGYFALPPSIASAIPFSHPQQIVTETKIDVSPPSFMGEEPSHTWCYFFEKADLARQEGKWEEVARLGDAAFAVPYLPDDPYEYFPFIEAYARAGRWKDARDLTRTAVNNSPSLAPMLCALWERVEALPSSPISQQRIEKMKHELRYCPYP